MFQTGGAAIPTDNATLHAALAGSLAPFGLDPSAVTLKGTFPSLSAIRINLSGAHFTREFRTVKMAAERAQFVSRLLEVSAAPAHLESLPIRLALHAEDCKFSLGTGANGNPVICPAECSIASGRLEAEIADIEAAMLAAGKPFASAKGAELESIRISLNAGDSRTLAFTAVAKARAMLFTATLTIRGRVTIDERFTVKLTDLACTGDGVIANLAVGFIQPRLAQFEGRQFSTARLLPEGLELTDVALASTPSLQIQFTARGKR